MNILHVVGLGTRNKQLAFVGERGTWIRIASQARNIPTLFIHGKIRHYGITIIMYYHKMAPFTFTYIMYCK